MRRFIASLTGKVFSQLVILALLLPSISLALLSRAEAQVAVLPQWAVVEFRNLKSPGTTFGRAASDAVASELAKTGQYDVTPKDTVDRVIKDLGIASPPDGTTNLMRVAQEIRNVSTIVSGDVMDYRILQKGTGKQAVVQLSVVVYDVASELPVNGSVVKGESTVRPSDAKDEDLINDAISQGSSQAIREILSRTLPTGTVLNTLPTTALINKGTRSGFSVGQEVIVIRGREQVATARVSDVEPDSSTIHIEKFIKGVQPGDKVRAIWEPPTVRAGIQPDGHVETARPHRSSNNSGLISVLIVLGIVAALLGNGGSSDQSVLSDVTSEAELFPAIGGQPAVRISWTPNGFAKGNSTRVAWQVFRNDVPNTPVMVEAGSNSATHDFNIARTNVTYTTRGFVGIQDSCDSSVNNATIPTVPGVQVGHPYVYSVQLVFGLSILDLPSAGSASSASSTGTTAGGTGTTAGGTGTTAGGTGTTAGGTTGTTAGGTTGTTATGTTASTGNTAGGQTCIFVSPTKNAQGTATPLNAPPLISPQDSAGVGSLTTFSFSSVATGGFDIAVEYVVQLSTSITFPKSQTATVAKVVKTGTGTVSTSSVDILKSVPSFIANATTVYWRVGAKNIADRPGPVPDPTTGLRYIFSQARSFTKPLPPPPPPLF